MPVLAQARHNARFLLRSQLGENVRTLRRRAQRRVVHRLHIRTEQQGMGPQPHLPAHAARHRVVVPGQHLDRDAVLLQRGNGSRRGILRGIEEGEIPDEHHVRLVRHGKRSGDHRIRLVGHGDDAQPGLVVPPHRGEDLLAQRAGERLHIPLVFRVAANGEHFLHRALGDDLRLAGLVRHNHAHAPPGEIERDFVHLPVILPQREHVRLVSVIHDGFVHQVAQAGLMVAVQEGVAQDTLIHIAVHVERIFQHDAILRQGPGLVRAQDVHGPEILDRIEMLYDDLFPGHGDRALGEVGGHDHGQHFRGQAHSHGQREQRCLHPVAFRKAVEEEHHRNHAHHEPDEHPRYGVHALLEIRADARFRNAPGQSPEQRILAHGDHEGQSRTANHSTAHEREIVALQRIAARLRLRGGPLFHRFALAGQR